LSVLLYIYLLSYTTLFRSKLTACNLYSACYLFSFWLFFYLCGSLLVSQLLMHHRVILCCYPELFATVLITRLGVSFALDCCHIRSEEHTAELQSRFVILCR